MEIPIAPESMHNAHGGLPPPECRSSPAAGAPHVTGKDMRPAAPASGNVAMFEKRTNLVRFLAVAETDRRGGGTHQRHPADAHPPKPRRAVPHGPGAVSGCPSASDGACPRIPIGLHFFRRPCVLARPTLPKASPIAMPYAVRLNPDPPAGRTGSDGLKFRMATSGIRAGALLCRSGTAWVSDRIQTRVYRRRPLSSLEEHDAKSQEHPNDKRSLVTHTLDDGRSSWAKGDAPRPRFENGCLGRARREDLDRQFPLGRGGGYDASMPAASPRPAPTRFGRQRNELCPILGDGVIRRRREFWFRRSAYRF